jgi:hypothetical protein
MEELFVLAAAFRLALHYQLCNSSQRLPILGSEEFGQYWQCGNQHFLCSPILLADLTMLAVPALPRPGRHAGIHGSRAL